MSEWQPIEAMPSRYDWVLVCQVRNGTDEPSSISIGRWDGDRWELLADGDAVYSDLWWDIEADKITHWMPLPAEPLDKSSCKRSGCKRLETVCKDCGRLVNTVEFKNE